MTDATTSLAVASLAVPLAGAVLVAPVRSRRLADRISLTTALMTAAAALSLAGLALSQPERAEANRAFLIDGMSGVFVAVIAIVGLLSRSFRRAT